MGSNFCMVSLKFFIKTTLVLLLTIGGSFTAYYFIRTHLSVALAYKKDGMASTSEWSLSFGREVRVMRAALNPPVSGKWYVKNGLFGSSVIKFVPTNGFVKGETYVADIAIARTYDKGELIEIKPVRFIVSSAPGVASITIDGERKKIIPRPLIELVTDETLMAHTLVPSIVGYDIHFEEITKESNRIVWKITDDLPYGTRLVFQVKDEKGALIIAREIETVVEPKIEHFSAKEYVIPGDIIKVSFNAPMATEPQPLTFDIAGSGVWTDPRTYEYTVSAVSGGMSYAVRLLQGARSLDGGIVTVEDTRMVSSPGAVVASFQSLQKEYNIQTPIEISFSQPVDRVSAEKAFRISPTAKGSFSWQGETLIFTPTKLAYQKRYTISLNVGIKAEYGLPSTEKVSKTFVTVPEVHKLAVPYYQQEYSRSCEAAALRMALAYLGINTNDMDIIKKIGYDPRPKDVARNEWDDPREMFVGYVSKTNGDGYGVYGAPIARAAEGFGRDAHFTTDITPQFLAQSVLAGNPVVLWGYTTLASPISWRTPKGGEVTALPGEHARLVVGVYGSASDPVGFYLHDPLSGKQYEYWDAGNLMKHVRAVPGVTNQAVVVM